MVYVKQPVLVQLRMVSGTEVLDLPNKNMFIKHLFNYIFLLSKILGNNNNIWFQMIFI